MARMIPDINPLSIENGGERRFYHALRELPDDFTVCYSFRFRQNEMQQECLRETDFVVFNPQLGYAVVEVKQGEISYRDGVWHEFKNGRETPLHKDPVKQAREGMFAILEEYRKRSGSHRFPLDIRFALCFPESTRLEGTLPPELKPESVFLFADVENSLKLTDKIMALFSPPRRAEKEVADILLNKILAPSFKIFSRLEDEFEHAGASMEKFLTEEQERILTETELDHRKIFLGAAGSGKTFIAMEKCRRLIAAGQKVFITCFNKNLASYLRKELPGEIFVSSLHDFFLQTARKIKPDLDVPENSEERANFFTYQLPALAFDYLADLPEDEKFDTIIVDEGQDLKIEWFDCLEAALKKDGGFYIFADPAQSIFHHEIEEIKKMPVSKHQLTRNLRNTGTINDWIAAWVPGRPMSCAAESGFPVHFIPYSSPETESLLIEKEIGRLVSQGVSLKRIQILSPHRFENSCLAGKNRIKEWSLINSIEARGNGIRFSTIRSFKGLEADIVFLIDITPESRVCTDADIYVGGSRARFMLYIFHDREMEWSRNP